MLQVFGDLALWRRDPSARIGEARRKPLAVLAYLLDASPDPVNREVLAALLWPGLTPEGARRTLTQSIYALRRELCDDDAIQGTSQLSINMARLGSDLAEFRAALTARDYERALAAYRGPFLDGVAFRDSAEFDHWMDHRRDRWAHTHRDAVLASVRKPSASLDAPRIIARLADAHATYPMDAAIATALAEAHLGGDDPHSARRVIDAFEARLRRDLELPLPSTLAAMRDALRDRFRATAPSHVPSLPSSASDDAEAHSARTEEASTRSPRRVRFGGIRRWPTMAAAALLVTSAASIAVFAVRRLQADRAPVTLYDDMMQHQAAARARHLARVDSSKMGRVLLLSASNTSGREAMDSLLPNLNYTLRLGESASFATAIPPEEVQRLEAIAATNRNPTSTTLEIARMMHATGAALALWPKVSVSNDSIMVGIAAFRDLTHTPAARPGSSNLELVSGLYVRAPNAREANRKAMQAIRTFVLSLESCAVEEHLPPHAAPWCWTSRDQLRVVPGLFGARVAERARLAR
jgi:DNA-binding SARP family transcriptional activator